MDTAREFYAHLPPPAECLAILVGCAELTVFGLGGLANPVEFAKGYGLPLSPSSTSQKQPDAIDASSEQNENADDVQKTQTALVCAIAARNVTSGMLILGFACYTRDRRALGCVIIANVITTLADALIVRWSGNKSQVFGHATGVVNSLAIGGSLLYWRREDTWW